MFKSPGPLALLSITLAASSFAQTHHLGESPSLPPAGPSMPPAQRELEVDLLDQADRRRAWSVAPGRFGIGRWEHGYYVTWRSFLNGAKFPEVRQYKADGALLREFPVKVGSHTTIFSVSATKSGAVLITGLASQKHPEDGFEPKDFGWHTGAFLLIAEPGGEIRRIMLGDDRAAGVCSNEDKTFWMVAWNNANRTPILRQINSDGLLLTAVVKPPNAVNLDLLHYTTALRCTEKRIGLYYSGTWYEYDITEKNLRHWKLAYEQLPSGVTFSEAGQVYFSVDEPRAQRRNPMSVVLQVASLPARRKSTTLYAALLRLNKDPEKELARLEFIANTLGSWNSDGTGSGFTRLVGVDGDDLVYVHDGREGRRLAWGRPQ